MAERRELWTLFMGDAKSLDKASKNATRDLQGVEKQSGKSNRAIGGLNKGVTALASVVGIGVLGNWANDAAKMADSANAAARSIDKSLGPAAQDFRDQLEENRHAMGLNILEVDQLGASMGLMITGMGGTEQAAADLGAEMVDIAGNLAAFRGNVAETPAAIDAIGSALKGQFDPLEAFGVKLSEAQVKAEIARLEGIDPLFAAMGAGEKRIIAINGLIRSQAAPAMDALTEATDSTAASTAAAQTEMEDLQLEFGKSVNMIKGPLMQALVIGLRGFKSFFEGIGEAIALFLIANWDTIIAIRDGWRSLMAFMSGIGRGIVNLFDSISRAIGGISRGIGGLIGKAQTVAKAIGRIRIPGFATGGVVPGAAGSPQLVVAHGGERISKDTGGKSGMGGGGGGGGGGTTIINVNVESGISDPVAMARTIVDTLRVYNTTNGPLPLEVRS